MTQRLFHISRPALWINTIGPAFIGLWCTDVLWRWDFWPLLLWLTLPFNLLIYGINDIFDWETDNINHRKGSWEGARINKTEFARIAFVTLGLNVPFLVYFATAFSATALLWIATYTAVFIFYSAPPVRFKARPFWDSLSNFAYGLPILFVPLALNNTYDLWLVLGLCMWSVAKHAYDAIQDIDVDSDAGILTTANSLGVQKTLLWSGTWWTLSTLAFAQLSLVVALINQAYVVYLLLPVWREPQPSTAKSYYKASVLFPYFVGTLGGVLLALKVWRGLP